MLHRRFSAVILCLVLLAGFADAANIPRHSPEFAINMADGRQTLLSQYHGKVVVLAFILTTCPHCQHTIGILGKLQNEYGPQRLQVLSAAMEDAAKANVPGFIKQFQPPFPVGYSGRDSVVEYLQHPPMLSMHMPNLVFIDRAGNIVAQYAGDSPFVTSDDQEKNIRSEIDKLLKDGASGGKSTARKAGAARATK